MKENWRSRAPAAQTASWIRRMAGENYEAENWRRHLSARLDAGLYGARTRRSLADGLGVFAILRFKGAQTGSGYHVSDLGLTRGTFRKRSKMR